MPRSNLVNAVDVALAADVTGTDTEIQVTSPELLPAVPFYLVIDPFADAGREYMHCTAVNGDLLTVTRNLDGTESTTHTAGDTVRISYVAQILTDIWNAIEAIPQPFSGLHADLTDVAEDQHHAKVHTHAPGEGTGTVLHCDLGDILPDDHHARYTDDEARNAVGVLDLDGTYLRLDATNDPQERFDVNIGAGGGDGVGFDGASYLEVVDQNLLDGDSAHLHQSIGGWVVSNNSEDPAQSQALTPKIGDWHGSAVAGAEGALHAIQVIPTPEIPAVENDIFSAGAWLAADQPMEMRIGITFHTAVGGWIGATYSDYVDVDDSGFVWAMLANVVCPATTEIVRMRIQMRQRSGVNPVGGEVMYFDGVTLISGENAPSDTIPSLRIASPAETTDPPDMTATFAEGVGLRVGEGWTGTGFRYQMLDGAGGPLCAEFLAAEAITAINEGADSYTGADGRTWWLAGNLTVVPGGTTSPVATLADISGGGNPISHNDLLDVTADQHHTRYTDAEAIAAVGPVVEEAPTDGATYGRQNSGWVPVGDSGFDGFHDSLAGVTSDQHHARYTDTEAIDAVAGQFLPLTGGEMTGTITGNPVRLANSANPGNWYEISDTYHGMRIDVAWKFVLYTDRAEFRDIPVRATVGSSATPSYSFVDRPTNGLFSGSDEHVGIAVGGVQVIGFENNVNGVKVNVLANLGALAVRNIWQTGDTPVNPRKGDIWMHP